MQYTRPTRLILAAAALAFVVGCSVWCRQGPVPRPTPVPVSVPVRVLPLPGGLDRTEVFNSNSPEIVQQEGVVLSTLPGPGGLDHAFTGAFRVFSHHIASDVGRETRLLTLGLLARNPGPRPVVLTWGGSSYLSQPDAPFVPLPPVLDDPAGTVYAGPGDRVATDLLHGRASMPVASMTLAAGATEVVASWSVPTDVVIPPPINGRNTQLALHATGPVQLAEVAVFARRAPEGSFLPVPGDAYRQVLAAGGLAGPREATPSAFDPMLPPATGAFRFGRVAGVSRGDRWEGELASRSLTAELRVGDRLAVPFATTYLARLGTGQNQSASLQRRYPDTAFQAHGNFGVTYVLRVRLVNPDLTARTYALGLAHAIAAASASATFLEPPGPQITFRGPVRLDWAEAGGGARTTWAHVVLRRGELPPPFEAMTLPPRTDRTVTVTMVYPADATPPQLLVIARR